MAGGGRGEATISYAASSALAKQIEEGAPADVFVSADLDWMAYLAERDLVQPDTEVELLGNRLALVAPADSEAAAAIAPGFDLAGLLGDGRLAIANVDAVPAGRYGKAALEALGVWESVSELAQAENVRAALALVALGEAPLGIVYATDAAAEPAVRTVGVFPEDTHPPIVYPAAATAEAGPDAAAFLAFLQSAPARAIFEARASPCSPRRRTEAASEGRAMEWLRLSPDEWTAVRLSLRVSAWATLVSLPLGILVAHLLARREFPGKALVNGLVHLPLILPPVVTGYLLLLTFGRRGPVGALLEAHFGIVFAFRWTGAALACGVMAFPLMVRAIRLSIEGVDRRLEAAAGTLGAGPLWVFATVTLPLILPGIVVGMILTFAKAMGEFGATITFVSNIPGETQTLPSAIYTFTQVPGGQTGALRLTLVSIAIAMAALIASEAVARRVNRRLDVEGPPPPPTPPPSQPHGTPLPSPASPSSPPP